jgi:flagellar basal body rod protein FlgB
LTLRSLSPQVSSPAADDGRDLNLDQATTPRDGGRLYTREGIGESFLTLSLIDSTQLALEAGMRGAWLRQTLLTNNIANADTPGYQREDVNFQATLRSALANAGETSGGGEAGGAGGSGAAGGGVSGNEAGSGAVGGSETTAGNEASSGAVGSGETTAGNEASSGAVGSGETTAGNEALAQLQFHPEVQPGAIGPEGNGVSIDQESAQIAENGLDYQAMTQVLGARDTILRAAMGVS